MGVNGQIAKRSYNAALASSHTTHWIFASEGNMSDLNAYLKKRSITEEQMANARCATQAAIDAYSLREARKANRRMTQAELAQAMGVSQTRDRSV